VNYLQNSVSSLTYESDIQQAMTGSNGSSIPKNSLRLSPTPEEVEKYTREQRPVMISSQRSGLEATCVAPGVLVNLTGHTESDALKRETPSPWDKNAET
jgi:hypothetical protein